MTHNYLRILIALFDFYTNLVHYWYNDANQFDLNCCYSESSLFLPVQSEKNSVLSVSLELGSCPPEQLIPRHVYRDIQLSTGK